MAETIVSAPTCTKCQSRPRQPNRAKPSGFGDWCAECRYAYDLWRWYRLTPEDYAAMLAGQADRCAVCREPFGEKHPHVDHRHGCPHPDKGRASGRGSDACCRECVRGLVCASCNHLLGTLETRLPLLAAALGYLGIEMAEP